MNDDQYREHCIDLLNKFSGLLAKHCEQCSDDDPLRTMSEGFNHIATGAELYSSGPVLVNQLFASCPDLAPYFPREILWFLGGECLHLMPDREIAIYQQLDDQRWSAAEAGKILHYHDARAKLLKLQ
ncbi:dehydrogenase [Halieaceae bacterium IMCC14734]|uniref:Dehydrogenase n=1 Tax=Candidatus Litorirhabdus singularis TaxID=2518993 RepID=A0ABT3THH8_9GAMM|nr:PA2817 family protein [Candidatus Litorirhabdus singularis]MCX2981454.1 dehydrogenase [Candidatus Litorirhabdus singularis]